MPSERDGALNFAQIWKKQMHILVVEDDYFTAQAISDEIRSLGNSVLGPVATARDAAVYVEDADAAILDICLTGHTSFSVADAFQDRHVPFLFLTGHTTTAIPARFRSEAVRSKPSTARSLLMDLYRIRMCNAASDSSFGVMIDMLNYTRLKLHDHRAAERLVEGVMQQAIVLAQEDAPILDVNAMLVNLLDARIAHDLRRHFN